MPRPYEYPPFVFSIIDASRSYLRLRLAEQCCLWSESLFEGNWKVQLDDVAPHLFACDHEGAVAWLTLRDLWGGEAGLVIESALSFPKMRRQLRRMLITVRAEDHKQALFRFYDPRVLRPILSACTTDELHYFFQTINAIHCQSESKLHVTTFTMQDDQLAIMERHIDQWMLDMKFFTAEEMAEAQSMLPQIQEQQKQ